MSRTVASITDKRIVLRNEQCGRTISIGSSWTKIRIGVRHAINRTTAYNNAPSFVFGLCSGTAAMYTDPTTANFIGYRTKPGANWTTPSGQLYNTEGQAITKVGTVITALSDAVVTGFTQATVRNSATFLEIQKGAENYQIMHAQTDARYDFTEADFITWMQSETLPWNSWTKSMAVDEATNGTLDTINIAWLGTTEDLEICDVAYSRLI